VSEPDLLAAVGPVLDALPTLGVRHFIGASIASSAHGLARASIDADVVAELRAEHTNRFVAALSGGYYVSEERVRDAITRRTAFNVIHLDSMLKVDVFVSKDRPFDRRAMERAQTHPTERADDRSLPLASAEDTCSPNSNGIGAVERFLSASGRTSSESYRPAARRWNFPTSLRAPSNWALRIC
jgi:hypothetical protein